MKRLPISGASLACSELTPDDLREALERLQVSRAYDQAAVDDLYFELGSITGAWLALEESKEYSPVAAELRRAGAALASLAELLSGRETGLKSTTQIFATRLTAETLALDPTLKGDAHEYLSKVVEDAKRVGHACQIAAALLSEKSELKGREKLAWYDDFTKLLLRIAERGGVRPTFGNDDIRDTPCGWLFDAARELELFLFNRMRSPSVKACGKRLERSLKSVRAE
jgi:hypothetical protein